VVAVDTNVVVRLLTLDDAHQAARAKRLFAANRIFLPMTVLLEAEWVLRRLYRFKQEQVTAALRGLIALENLEPEDPNAAEVALDWAHRGLDFADALHLASSLRTHRFATFDAKLISRAQRLQVTSVQQP
jgi:predicted nucleic-acid-binding protein